MVRKSASHESLIFFFNQGGQNILCFVHSNLSFFKLGRTLLSLVTHFLGMVDGGRTHVIDASSLNGGKSKSGSLRSTDDIEGSSSAGGASQSSNRSISSKVSLNRSKDNSTEDNLYDSIEMLNSGRRHTQLKTNESAASSVTSSVTRHATASSRQIVRATFQ